jgi:hypothetical protein
MVNNITTIAKILFRLLILLFSLQSIIAGPKEGWHKSQSCSFSEDLAKQNALNSKKGVVGNKGNNIPTMPKIREKMPEIIKKIFILMLVV